VMLGVVRNPLVPGVVELVPGWLLGFTREGSCGDDIGPVLSPLTMGPNSDPLPYVPVLELSSPELPGTCLGMLFLADSLSNISFFTEDILVVPNTWLPEPCDRLPLVSEYLLLSAAKPW